MNPNPEIRDAAVTGTGARAFVVLNPRSGSCTVEDVRQALTDHLAGASVDVHEVGAGDDLAAIVREAVERGYQLIVAAGGDGTVGTVADALVGTSALLGILPLGTANVLARELGIPVDLEGSCRLGACRLLDGAHSIANIDVMKIGDRHYLTQVGVGIDSLMIRDTSDATKRRFGRMAYLKTALVSLIGFQPQRFLLEIDGKQIRKRASQVLVANVGILGQKPFRWGPDIKPDDGHLDVCIIRARTILDYLALFWHAGIGKHHRDPNVRYAAAERAVLIDAKHPLPVQADGEIIGQTPIRVEVVRGALRVLVPAAADAPSENGP